MLLGLALIASDLLCIDRERAIVLGPVHGSVQSIDDCILLCHALCYCDQL